MADYHNPLSAVIPHDFQSHHDYPTEIVAQRFQAYRDIVKDLISYLRQYASVQEEIVRQQVRLQQAVGATTTSISATVTASDRLSRKEKQTVHDDELNAINQFFLPIGNGSIQDIPTILTKYHQQNIQAGNKTLKDINQVIIPKLEDLRKDLLVKVKEIKNLQNDFKNTLSREMNETRSLISAFNHSIDAANHLELLGTASHHETGGDIDISKKDPYLVKIKLDRQLKKQVYEESYLYEAYKNLQESSEKLESIVVLEIQNYMGMFLGLIENESACVTEFLLPNLREGFLGKEPNLEWEAFIQRNLPRTSSISNHMTSGMFIDLTFPTRKLTDFSIPHYDSLLNVAVREGPLERRSKFLKSYSGGWYVLTCSFLHEFKSSDRKKDQIPVMSLSLDHCSVSEHSKNDGKASGAYKFVLYSKLLNGLIHRSHNWSFRCDTYQGMIEWYNDIKTLTGYASPLARAKAMSKKLMANNAESKRLSRVSSNVSAQTGARSLRSTNTNNKLRNKLSTKAGHASIVSSSAVSRKSSTSESQNKRLSSTFSQKYHQSPRLSNFINSDGTAVASLDSQHKAHRSVDQNGNIILRGTFPDPEEKQSEDKGNGFVEPKATNLPEPNVQTPQQTIPQNYQYYLNLVNQQPQQFYDPVLQQFFTINAIPALQVTQFDQSSQPPQMTQVAQFQSAPQSQSSSQPMPQYFPSSPLPHQAGQVRGATPSKQVPLFQTSPPLMQGQFEGESQDGQNSYMRAVPAQARETEGLASHGAPFEDRVSIQNLAASIDKRQDVKNVALGISKVTVTDE